MGYWQNRFDEANRAIRKKRPLVHHITNYVVMNLTANVTLALGASPVMAHDIDEVEEMASLASAVVLNIGTLSPRWVEAMLAAGRTAKARKIPVIFDPVGAGATQLRTAVCRRILEEISPDIIRGNRAEVTILAGAAAKIQGVDSLEEGGMEPVDLYRALAKTSGAVVCVSGPVDWVSDGDRTLKVENGHPLFAKVTGMGCSATTAVGVYACVGLPLLESTALGMAAFGVCGEIAAENAQGPGSFVPALLDALYHLPSPESGSRLRISEA